MNLIKECWDTCLFIYYLNDEPIEKNRVDIVDALLRLYESPNSNRLLVVSTIVISEVQLRDRYNQQHWEVIQDIFYTARRFIKVQVLTPKIAQIASKLRTAHNMGLADAINIATASLERCDVLYTFDGSGAHPRPNDILQFDGIIADAGLPPLKIKVPQMPLNSQMTLSSR